MEGIENIKTCVGFVLDLTDDVQKSLADGKFNLKDSILFVDNIPQIPRAIRSATRFWQEFQELDADEETAIIQFVSDRIQCDNAKAKSIIVQSFKTAITISELVCDGVELSRIIKAA